MKTFERILFLVGFLFLDVYTTRHISPVSPSATFAAPGEEGVPVDVISVECWAPDMSSPVNVLQSYEPFAKMRRFRLFGESRLVIGGVVLDAQHAAPALDVVREGLESHSAVAPLLPRRREADDAAG